MTLPDFTHHLVVAVVLFLLAYDFLVIYLLGRMDASISLVVNDLVHRHPAWLLGIGWFVCHLFTPTRFRG